MKRFLTFFVIILLIVAVVIFFLVWQSQEQPSSQPTEQAQDMAPEHSEDLRSLVVENATLILEAGKKGITLSADWRTRGTQAAKLIEEGKNTEAAAMLRELNADIRAAIDAK